MAKPAQVLPVLVAAVMGLLDGPPPTAPAIICLTLAAVTGPIDASPVQAVFAS